jgi:molybdate-binding protein
MKQPFTNLAEYNYHILIIKYFVRRDAVIEVEDALFSGKEYMKDQRKTRKAKREALSKVIKKYLC